MEAVKLSTGLLLELRQAFAYIRLCSLQSAGSQPQEKNFVEAYLQLSTLILVHTPQLLAIYYHFQQHDLQVACYVYSITSL